MASPPPPRAPRVRVPCNKGVSAPGAAPQQRRAYLLWFYVAGTRLLRRSERVVPQALRRPGDDEVCDESPRGAD